MRHCRSSPCGIAAHQNAALPLMSYAVIYMRHCRLCGWMDEANGVPTLILHTETPRHRGTETPRHRGTETPRHRDTETPRNRDTETPRHRDTETQRVAGKAVVFFYHCYDETLSLYTRSLLGDCSKLWVLRPEALLVRNVNISIFTTVLSPLLVRSRLLQAIEEHLVDSSRSLVRHPRSRLAPARLVGEKRRHFTIGTLNICAELQARVRQWQWAVLRIIVLRASFVRVVANLIPFDWQQHREWARHV